MKKAIKYKNLISLTVIFMILLSITISCSAVWVPQRMKAGIAAAITALNITLNSTTMPIQEMIDYVSDPFDVSYSYSEAWNDRPQIQIWDDYITIDGEQYTDIWISNEAAEKFRVNAFDFKSAYNIASQSNGTFAEGVGSFNGLPLFNVNGTVQSQTITCPLAAPFSGSELYPFGSYKVGGIQTDDNRYSVGYYKPNNTWTTTYGNVGQASFNYYSPYSFKVAAPNNNNVMYMMYGGGGNPPGRLIEELGTYISNPFDFDYVSGNIPANNPLPSDTGMMIRVPSNDTLGNPYFDDFLTNNPEFNQGEPVTIDVNIDPEINTKLDDLFDIIAPIIPIINNNMGDINFTTNHTEPVPAPDPAPAPDVDPDTPINEITYNDYYQTITNQTEYINDSVEHIYNSQQEIIENQDQIIENQDTIIQESIPEIIDNIPKIDEICNNIDTAPYHDLDTGLDHLPSIFLPFITDLRSALGIWHYVTEWLAQISNTFAFISGCLVGTSIMTPIYAAIAGFMCIKIYRRMTE